MKIPFAQYEIIYIAYIRLIIKQQHDTVSLISAGKAAAFWKTLLLSAAIIALKRKCDKPTAELAELAGIFHDYYSYKTGDEIKLYIESSSGYALKGDIP